MVVNLQALWLRVHIQIMDNEDLVYSAIYDSKRTSAGRKRMQFCAGPNEESTFSCLQKHHRVTVNDQVNLS